MKNKTVYQFLNLLIASVWVINGLFCKVLNLVPRHQQIVARILGDEYSRILTITIGISEIGMAIWILSGIKRKLNVISQIIIVMAMNVIEFFTVPDLLLWDRANILFALIFVSIVYYNEFNLRKGSFQKI